jgi:hypothetical protein
MAVVGTRCTNHSMPMETNMPQEHDETNPTIEELAARRMVETGEAADFETAMAWLENFRLSAETEFYKQPRYFAGLMKDLLWVKHPIVKWEEERPTGVSVVFVPFSKGEGGCEIALRSHSGLDRTDKLEHFNMLGARMVLELVRSCGDQNAQIVHKDGFPTIDTTCSIETIAQAALKLRDEQQKVAARAR